MHAEPETHYKGCTIVANPVETIRRRFMDIFTIYESEHATFPLCHHQAAGSKGFLTLKELSAALSTMYASGSTTGPFHTSIEVSAFFVQRGSARIATPTLA